MITSYSKLSKKEIYKYIQLYTEEAETNLNLYTSGKDNNALQRYEHLMNHVRELRKAFQSK